jgi:TolA-binding protein
MKPTEQDITLVERYFDAELNEDELKNFNARITQDDTFKALVHREKIIIGAIRNQGLIDNLQYLKTIEEKLEHEHPTMQTSRIKPWHYYAAAACIVLVLAVKFLLPSQQTSSDELFAAYFTPYSNVFEPTVRSAEPQKSADQSAEKRSEAFQAYERGEYQRASILFTQLLKEQNESSVLFLLGNSNLMIGKVREAQENFVTLIRDFDDLDLQAKWYLSLSYLKSGDTENARKILKELGETEVSYASKAKELLEKVD